jgi:hypothetical protein
MEYLDQGEELTGDWRQLSIEEFHNLYTLPIIIKMVKSRTIKEEEKRMRLLVGKPERKRLLGRSKPRWVENIKSNL